MVYALGGGGEKMRDVQIHSLKDTLDAFKNCDAVIIIGIDECEDLQKEIRKLRSRMSYTTKETKYVASGKEKDCPYIVSQKLDKNSQTG